jgi:hypothetical protein
MGRNAGEKLTTETRSTRSIHGDNRNNVGALFTTAVLRAASVSSVSPWCSTTWFTPMTARSLLRPCPLSRLSLFLAYQPHRHVSHRLETRRRHLVDRVVRGVPRRVVEVHDVDGSDADLLQLEVVVDERVLG